MLALAWAGCGKKAGEAASGGSGIAPGVVANQSYEVVQAWPHDRSAFTQGLVFFEGALLESTGLNGESTLREVELKTGRVIKRVALPREYFGEGLAVLGDRAFLLTWRNGKAFVYDRDTFRLLQEFAYEGEGWGLATDGRALILSDGTSRIRFIDPVNFAVQRTIVVQRDGQPVEALNELEYIRGEIFANVWQTDTVVRIDPASGRVLGTVDFAGLLPAAERDANTDVLNGIAYDAAGDRLFVTGKRWPKVFEVRLKPRP